MTDSMRTVLNAAARIAAALALGFALGALTVARVSPALATHGRLMEMWAEESNLYLRDDYLVYLFEREIKRGASRFDRLASPARRRRVCPREKVELFFDLVQSIPPDRRATRDYARAVLVWTRALTAYAGTGEAQRALALLDPASADAALADEIRETAGDVCLMAAGEELRKVFAKLKDLHFADALTENDALWDRARRALDVIDAFSDDVRRGYYSRQGVPDEGFHRFVADLLPEWPALRERFEPSLRAYLRCTEDESVAKALASLPPEPGKTAAD
ncbi:MAG: hypothetical protein M5R36_26615 [Deltaproteobacteria bacterium]|nr:hypothetical protein [Deltaproteobacteria bacterium]